ncbi:hypothetical protein [Halobaculum litoreum]|uniref:Uncharacterized protein n=1 Tax=Halobaculum litoreum TaxID=3031998 RepID=A0ABD5XR35_9EURY|nr:hypothetical protein [Halobaculum sp. DT92]
MTLREIAFVLDDSPDGEPSRRVAADGGGVDPEDAEFVAWCDDGCEAVGWFAESKAAQEVAGDHRRETGHFATAIPREDAGDDEATGGESA